MTYELDKAGLLGQLDRIKYDNSRDEDAKVSTDSNLGKVLLNLAEIDPEREHKLCSSVARHLAGSIPEPQEDDLPV